MKFDALFVVGDTMPVEVHLFCLFEYIVNVQFIILLSCRELTPYEW